MPATDAPVGIVSVPPPAGGRFGAEPAAAALVEGA
jgi:hypothetical protein